MKKFNLEQALQGKPVVTGNGRKVNQLVLFKTASVYPLCGVLDSDVKSWTKDGKFNTDVDASPNDLFMVEEEMYIILNESEKEEYEVQYSKIYLSADKALIDAKEQDSKAFKLVEVEKPKQTKRTPELKQDPKPLLNQLRSIIEQLRSLGAEVEGNFCTLGVRTTLDFKINVKHND